VKVKEDYRIKSEEKRQRDEDLLCGSDSIDKELKYDFDNDQD